MLAIIPCGKKKTTIPQIAKRLYTGSYFKLCLSYALSITTENNIRILSAKYAFIPLNKMIVPYNVYMGENGCINIRDAYKSAKEQGIIEEPIVVVLGGSLYIKICKEIWPHCLTPLEGVGGMGDHKSWLKNHTQR